MESQNVTNLVVLTETYLLFFNKYSSDCCEPLANFPSSEKVDFDGFCQRSCCFCRGAGF